jgi:exopolyphosphatase/guanosine-5'-triphosphate,3'-diphosphate pyrophosphatase
MLKGTETSEIPVQEPPPLQAGFRPGSHASGGLAYAALDLGTNNCRLMVGTPSAGGFRVVDSFSRIVRLGEGLHDTGRLSEEAMERAMLALLACAARLGRRPMRDVRAIATEACRRATNGPKFLSRVKAETGIDFDIITPREEAELALDSCGPLLTGDASRALLFDIGGGSTELGWVRMDAANGPRLVGYASLPLGVVTLAEQFGEAGFTEAGFEAMVAEVADRLAAFDAVHCIAQEIRSGCVQLVGTSGTVTTLAGIALGLPRYRRMLVDGHVLSGEDAIAALETLRALGREGLAQHPCVGPDRVDFVLPGCAVFAAIIRQWPAARVVVADRGLREGMLLRMIRADRARSQPRNAWDGVCRNREGSASSGERQPT